MRQLCALILLVLLLPALQGCFPVVAAGAGTGALMADDRRTPGIFVEDEGIEIKTANRIGDALKGEVHVNVTSFNRNVLLTGEARTAALRQEAEQIAKGVANVRDVTNEITVSALTSFASRSNDTFITSKVKVRMLDANKFSPNHVKVVTENGAVYLMGLVTRKEAEDAAEIARSTSGVQRVVKVFEYID